LDWAIPKEFGGIDVRFDPIVLLSMFSNVASKGFFLNFPLHHDLMRQGICISYIFSFRSCVSNET
jgi:hypothetical protein